MAGSIINACGNVSVSEILGRPGVWAWLAFVLRDQVYPRRKDGLRKLGEVHRWYPADINPVLLLSSFGANADHLLCGPPSVPGEVREQMTSQQDMFHPTIQAAARMLYYDESIENLRRGAAGKELAAAGGERQHKTAGAEQVT
jgi:hypothetical protein